MVEIRGRFLLLVVVVTGLAGLLVGWIGGIARRGLVGMTGTIGLVTGLALLCSILIVTWFALDERGTTR